MKYVLNDYGIVMFKCKNSSIFCRGVFTYCKRFYFGFTLAEVLITLVIVGVVAAITIPNVIKNYQHMVTINRLKEAYSLLNQVIKLSVAENGDTDKWDYTYEGSAYTGGGNNFSEKYIEPYLKILGKGYWQYGKQTLFYPADNYYYWSASNQTSYVYNLPNGITMSILHLADPNGANYSWDNGYSIYFTVDLNGPKKPNTGGRDMFTFILPTTKTYRDASLYKPNMIYPFNILNRGDTCEFTSNKSAVGCANVIIKNNWKFPDNYPY